MAVALVLSGGGSRGLAHIGALQVLEELGIDFSAVAGCSMGSIVGAAFAAGKTAKQMEEFAVQNNFYRFFNLSFDKLGINKTDRLQYRLLEFLGVTRFEELRTPLYVNATNISTGKEVTFHTGDLFQAIRASISIPGVMNPALIDGAYYIDGSVCSLIPVTSIPSKITKYIIVNVSPYKRLRPGEPLKLVNVLETSIRIMQDQMTQARIASIPKDNYVMITPSLEDHRIFEDKKKFNTIIAKGRDAALAKKKEIVQLFN